MTTAQDIITGAFKDLGVIQRNETPRGQEALDALDVLNFMCSSWIHDGIDMEWLTLEELSSVVPYPEDQIGPIRFNLALHIAPNLEVEPSQVLIAMAGNGYKQLQREYLEIGLLGMDTALHPYYNPNSQYVNGTGF